MSEPTSHAVKTVVLAAPVPLTPAQIAAALWAALGARADADGGGGGGGGGGGALPIVPLLAIISTYAAEWVGVVTTVIKIKKMITTLLFVNCDDSTGPVGASDQLIIGDGRKLFKLSINAKGTTHHLLTPCRSPPSPGKFNSSCGGTVLVMWR